MNQPGRFGPFLLFRETGSNQYRSCHRAGITRGRAIERIVRLEVFDRPGFEPAELLAELEAAKRIQSSLEDPHIAAGAGLGQVEGVPYAAYDFELGTTLAEFLVAARERSFPIPLDQALFIAERIALGLAAAHRVETDAQPSLHSFLTPDAVLLSNVGEVKVSGFETAPWLRRHLHGEPFCAPYLSSECRAGQAPHPVDDVYSLGSLLFELVTGEALPPQAPQLDRLIVRATGEGAPQALRELLEQSLAEPTQRIADVLEWQQSLGKLILDGEYNPTTFNLAFLLHTLLREPLEVGIDELEREKRFVLPKAVPPPEATPPPARTEAPANHSEDLLPPADSIHVPEQSSVAPPVPDASAGERRPFWIGFSISTVAATALLGSVLLSGGPSRPPTPDRFEPEAVPARPAATNALARRGESASVAPPSTATAPAPGPGPTFQLTEVVQGQIGAPLDDDQIERALAERAAEIERNLAAQYEQKLEALRAEMIALRALEERRLAESQGAPGAPERPNSSSDRQVESGSEETARTDVVSAREPAEPNGVRPTPGDAGFEPALAARESGGSGDLEAASAESSSRPFAPLMVPQTVPATESGAVATDTAPARDARLEPAAGPAPDPDLDPNVPRTQTPARLVRLKPPVYPPAAKRLGLSATARVQVVISPEGDVVEAEILGPELGSGFDRAALVAVKRSKWEPARREGEPIESTGVVTVQFQP